MVILVYHRFSDRVADSMTVRTQTFEAQLRLLKEHRYQVVPLRAVLAWLEEPSAVLPAKVAVLTADDGHRSVYDVLFPIARRDRLPVTLFIYPSAISNANYALSWEQVSVLAQSGLFDIQSHTYWHPNFRHERKRRSQSDYARFVRQQLEMSRERIEAHTRQPVDLLAWPFGIYDEQLMALATQERYIAALSLDARPVRRGVSPLALPRFLIVEATGTKGFAPLISDAAVRKLP
ncbi:polysaccharide deacetylase family protein [Caballeronia glebae]|uniref:polysaccharide deacetylase family protein n=1 Tax=Caballeronia glebae TaxID=1777143 RepID=UPI0038BA5922